MGSLRVRNFNQPISDETTSIYTKHMMRAVAQCVNIFNCLVNDCSVKD